ncbi:trypsin-like serine peptidase [Streptomyces sp. NBC_01092]|uniref:trypsin-like serine peptidase n=1 Tax=Streptomyces sp. NBC_01092 TaxID=2903748 RepID=UPI00386AF9F6|nr:trypsin-like peptidase domain-containing protein [Streptomyces sp. NBC_01092]
MPRTQHTHTSRLPLYAVAALLAVPSASAAAGAGTGPLGVTDTAAATAQSARVGALFLAGRRDHLRGGHVCTASVVHSPRHDLIVTAAHCLDGKREQLVFAPGYRDGVAPYGVWTVEKWFLSDGWVKERDEDSDVAFAVVERRGGKGVEDAVGGNRFAAGTAPGATAVTMTAYLNSRETPISCADKPRLHHRTQQRVACPGFGGGSSGSPWVDGDGQVVGVLGGHDNGGHSANVSYSVVFGAEAKALYGESAGCDESHVGSS